MQKMRYKEIKSICGKCGDEAIESPVEMLPKDGVLMRAIHTDGTEHRWAEYSSMFVGRDRKSRNDETMIMCPRCGKRGRVNSWRRNIQEHPEVYDYQVIHEKLSVGKHGTWGKDKMPKRKRCNITDLAQRDILLKKLGLYIEQGDKR